MNVFVQTTQIVCCVFTILVTINPLVQIVVQELVLANGFDTEPAYVQLFVMEETEPYNIHAEDKVRKMKDVFSSQRSTFIDLFIS